MSETGNLPQKWDEVLAKYAEAGAKAERPSASFISLRAGVLTYGGSPIPNNKLSCVILNSAYEHTYYTEKYDADNPRSPKCFALSTMDLDPSEIGPHSMSGDPQDERCAQCWAHKWRSDPNGGRGKACQERRRLILIPHPDNSTPDDVLAAEVAVMKLPVTSSKVWSNYVNLLSSLHRRPPFAMVTEITTQPDAKTQFKMVFTPQHELPHDVLSAIMQKRELSESVLLKPYDPSETEEAPKATKKGTKHEA